MKRLVYHIIICILFLAPSLVAQPTQKMRDKEIKVALLSLASGTTKVTYEQLVYKCQSIETTIGIIGWGFDRLKDSDPKGVALRLAYKFITPTEKNEHNQLCGYYCKPELCYSSYQYNHPNKGRLKVDYLALLWVVGYDWVIDWFVFDLYGGLGYAFGNNNFSNYHHGFICIDEHTPLALTAGFRIGVAF